MVSGSWFLVSDTKVVAGLKGEGSSVLIVGVAGGDGRVVACGDGSSPATLGELAGFVVVIGGTMAVGVFLHC
ncbi:MAG: hypothetical protein AAF226_12335 [Verrucomicrobiota bacterium]